MWDPVSSKDLSKGLRGNDPDGFILKIKEKVETNSVGRIVCFDAEKADLWREALIKAYGQPSDWSSDNLILFSDLLVVLESQDWKSMNRDELLKAIKGMCLTDFWKNINCKF